MLTVPTNFEEQADWGKNVRDVTGYEGDGMRILLTGDLGFSADSEEVFGELDTKLLLATVPWCSSCSARSTAPCWSR